jgi:hypothetical protein
LRVMRSFIFVFLLAVTACAGPIETRIDSAGMGPVKPATFQIGEAASAEALPTIVGLLQQKGFQQAGVGQLSLQIALSDRPAELALQSGSATLSPAKGKQGCAKREYRLGVTLTRLSDGTEVYRAHAAEFHCKLTLTDVLPILAQSALADLGAPRGAYTVNRPRVGGFRLIPAAPE